MAEPLNLQDLPEGTSPAACPTCGAPCSVTREDSPKDHTFTLEWTPVTLDALTAERDALKVRVEKAELLYAVCEAIIRDQALVFRRDTMAGGQALEALDARCCGFAAAREAVGS